MFALCLAFGFHVCQNLLKGNGRRETETAVEKKRATAGGSDTKIAGVPNEDADGECGEAGGEESQFSTDLICECGAVEDAGRIGIGMGHLRGFGGHRSAVAHSVMSALQGSDLSVDDDDWTLAMDLHGHLKSEIGDEAEEKEKRWLCADCRIFLGEESVSAAPSALCGSAQNTFDLVNFVLGFTDRVTSPLQKSFFDRSLEKHRSLCGDGFCIICGAPLPVPETKEDKKENSSQRIPSVSQPNEDFHNFGLGIVYHGDVMPFGGW